MRHHNKNSSHRDGQTHSNERMADDFDPPAPDGSFADWLYLAQVMQARALEMGVSWFRALSPWNSGAVYWQLNDCWPVASWSAIDGDGRLKPLWYASRRFFAPRLVTIKPCRVVAAGEAVGPLAVYLHNDSAQAWTTRLRLRLVGIDGRTLEETNASVTVAPRAVERVPVSEAWHGRPADTLLVADADGSRGTWFFRPDKELAYPPPAFDATLERDGDLHRLTLTAGSLLRDLCLFPDRLDADASVDEQGVTLLPGEAMTFSIHSRRPMTLEALTNPPVLQCVNRFGWRGDKDGSVGG